MLAVLVDSVHRPEAPVHKSVFLLGRRGRVADRTTRRQDEHTLGYIDHLLRLRFLFR